jgi:hypothetical protein
MDEAVPAGPLSMRIRIRAAADGVEQGSLREVVARGAGRCPVWDATKRAVDVSLVIETT